MPVVNLEDFEWQQVLAAMSLGPWREVNPLLMKIGAQLQHQKQQTPIQQPVGAPRLDANGKEIPHE